MHMCRCAVSSECSVPVPFELLYVAYHKPLGVFFTKAAAITKPLCIHHHRREYRWSLSNLTSSAIRRGECVWRLTQCRFDRKVSSASTTDAKHFTHWGNGQYVPQPPPPSHCHPRFWGGSESCAFASGFRWLRLNRSRSVVVLPRARIESAQARDNQHEPWHAGEAIREWAWIERWLIESAAWYRRDQQVFQRCCQAPGQAGRSLSDGIIFYSRWVYVAFCNCACWQALPTLPRCTTRKLVEKSMNQVGNNQIENSCFKHNQKLLKITNNNFLHPTPCMS